MGPYAEIEHVHQRRGVADLARNLERVLAVCERGLGIAEQPKSQRLPGQGCRADVLARGVADYRLRGPRKAACAG